MCSEQTSQSTCHGQTRTLPFAARGYVGTFEETYGWKEPARRPSKAPWGARGAWGGGARAAKRQQAPGGMGAHGTGRGEARRRHPLAHAQFPQSSARRVRTGAVRCGAVRCGAVRCGVVWCGAWRGCGKSGRPIRVELHSVHAAMRLHNCRRLPRFHQLESRASTRRRVLRACCRTCWGVGCARRLSDVEISTPGSARVHWPRENNAELEVIERVGVRRGCTCIVARKYS